MKVKLRIQLAAHLCINAIWVFTKLKTYQNILLLFYISMVSNSGWTNGGWLQRNNVYFKQVLELHFILQGKSSNKNENVI